MKPGRKGSITWDQNTFAIPQNHVPASVRITSELLSFIDDENITYINDFGAGVGQFKHVILSKRPNLKWNSYDGAGNVYEYTKGFVNYCDLTFPLELPKADWVVSLEVGEHIPNKYERMVIRNMHHHNCKGVILSWATAVQRGGHSHVNSHPNDFIILVFRELGYLEDLDMMARLRNPNYNHKWFTGSAMVLRRLNMSHRVGCSLKYSK